MTEMEYQRLKTDRHELCTLVAGYAWGALEAIACSDQVSVNVKRRVEGDLAYIRPIIAKIWDLGELTNQPPPVRLPPSDLVEGKTDG